MKFFYHTFCVKFFFQSVLELYQNQISRSITVNKKILKFRIESIILNAFGFLSPKSSFYIFFFLVKTTLYFDLFENLCCGFFFLYN